MSQSGQQYPQYPQYAQAGELTPEQARRMIMNAQNPHPGVSPGFDDPYPVGGELTRRGLEGALDAGIAAGTGALGPEEVAAGRAAVQAGKALGPRAYAEATNFGVNFGRGLRLGRNLDVFQRPLGFGPGSIAGHTLGVGAGVTSRVWRFVDDFF